MVGNGITDYMYDTWPSYPSSVYGFQYVPRKLYDKLVENNCTFYFKNTHDSSNSTECLDAYNAIHDLTSDLNVFDFLRKIIPGVIPNTPENR